MKEYSDDEDFSSDEEVGASDYHDFDTIELENLLNKEDKVNQRMLGDIIQAQEQFRREEEGDNALNKQIVVAFEEDQPEAVSLLGLDTSAHYFTDLEWKDRNDTKKWFIDKRIEIKCALVLGRHLSKERLEIVCERGGKQESHWAKERLYVKKTKREYITKSKKYGCPFKIIFNRLEKPDGSRVYKFSKLINGCHNHDDPESLVGHATVCELNPHQLETVRSMKACRPSDILRKIKEDDKENFSTLRQIYTTREAFRRRSWDCRAVVEQSQWLADQHGYTMRQQYRKAK